VHRPQSSTEPALPLACARPSRILIAMAPFEQLSVDTDGGNQVVSYLMTKHEKMLGLIPMQQSSLLELTRAGLITRDPETNCITNSWLFGDLLYIAAAGARLSLSINTKGNPLLCCLGDTKKLDCSFADAKEAASICTAIEQAMLHGYDESTVQRSAILAADDAQPAAAEPVAETEPLASLNDTMTDALFRRRRPSRSRPRHPTLPRRRRSSRPRPPSPKCRTFSKA